MVASSTPMPAHSETSLRRFVRRFSRNRGAVIAACYLGVIAVVAVIGPWIVPFHPDETDLRATFVGPLTDGYLLGTDDLGRDTFSRLVSATRVAVLAAIQSVALGLAVGVLPGLIAGYYGGWIDTAIMRVADSIQSFPPLILAIAIVGVLGGGLRNAMLAVGIIFVPTFVRMTRGSVLEIREESYVEASICMGTPTSRILLTRVLPNALPPLLVQIALAAGFALIAESALSFLGLGAQLPQASWGSMLRTGFRFINLQPWLIVFPGIAIALTVLAFNIVGDAIQDSIGREVRRE